MILMGPVFRLLREPGILGAQNFCAQELNTFKSATAHASYT